MIRCNRSNYSATITVLVGSNEEPFTVHEDIICARSEFFKAAVSKGWREAEQRIVRLPKHRPAVYKAYLECLYDPNTDVLGLARSHADDLADDDDGDIPKDPVKRKAGHGLVNLYILGDFVGDEVLRDQAFKSMVQGWNDHTLGWSVSAIRKIFENTSVNCGLQKFMAELLIRLKSPESVDTFAGVLPDCTLVILKAMIAERYGPGDVLDAEKYVDR